MSNPNLKIATSLAALLAVLGVTYTIPEHRAIVEAAAVQAPHFEVNLIWRTDSKGNLFTTKTYRGQRVRKSVHKGLAPVTTTDEGVVWPERG